MNRRLGWWSLAVMVGVGSGCKKSPPPAPPLSAPGPAAVTPEVGASAAKRPVLEPGELLVGRWGADGDLFCELRADGSGKFADMAGGNEFSWKADGKELEIRLPGGSPERLPYRFSGEVLVLDMDEQPMTLERILAADAGRSTDASVPGDAG